MVSHLKAEERTDFPVWHTFSLLMGGLFSLKGKGFLSMGEMFSL